MDSVSNHRKENGEWTVGSASHVITPEEPMWMAGFASRDNPADGIEHDLHTTAVAFEDHSGTIAAIVSIDVLYIPRNLRETVAKRCATEFGIPPDGLMVTATHTHCGPEFREFKLEMYADNVDLYVDRAEAYRKRLVDEIVSTVGDAISKVAPATLSYSHARCGFAMNRRLPVQDGIAHVSNPDGPVDHRVPVLVAERSGEPAMILFGYSCHPTTASVNRYSGDWIGFARREIESEYPEATAVFLLGCAGDQNPYPRGELDLAEHYGRSMATSVRAAIESRRKPVEGPLQTLFEEQTVEFEPPPNREELEAMTSADERYRRVRARSLLETLEERGKIPTEYAYPIQGFGFGDDLTLLGLGGEVLVEYGIQLEETLPGPVWVAGYANDEFTYVPTAQSIYEGGYEGGDVIQRTQFPGVLLPDVEERILRRVKAVADRVRADRE